LTWGEYSRSGELSRVNGDAEQPGIKRAPQSVDGDLIMPRVAHINLGNSINVFDVAAI